MSELAKHSEILFLWDAKMTNPNGDMLNDNAPRYDESDRRAVVSDVRVKRTIRDDLQYRKGKTVFVNNAEQVQSAETRFTELKSTLNEKDDKKVSQTLNQEIDLSFLTGNKVKTRDIIIFLQNLLVLKEANFNNIDALNMIIKSTESKKLKNILNETLISIEAGEYMYETMEKYPKVFPFIVTNIIKVGELSRNNGRSC